MTHYIIDKRTGEIVNAVETHSAFLAQQVADRMDDARHLRVTPNPGLEVLRRYRYWDGRP